MTTFNDFHYSSLTVVDYGISSILLNVGMYFVAPAVRIHTIRKF